MTSPNSASALAKRVQMRVTYDPTGKVGKAQPELTNEDIAAMIAPRRALYEATHANVMLIDTYHAESPVANQALAGFIDHTGAFHEYDSPITKLPLAVLVRGPEKVYFYQHGVTGFVYDEDGEHTSEIWEDISPV